MMIIKMKIQRYGNIIVSHNFNLFSRRFKHVGKLTRTAMFEFEEQNVAKTFEQFIRRNKPISLRRVVSFLKWERGNIFERNFNSLPHNPNFVHRYCGMRHYGKELIDLIDRRVKQFPNQTDYKLAERLKLTIEKTFNL